MYASRRRHYCPCHASVVRSEDRAVASHDDQRSVIYERDCVQQRVPRKPLLLPCVTTIATPHNETCAANADHSRTGDGHVPDPYRWRRETTPCSAAIR